jgi:hypothetical protein
MHTEHCVYRILFLYTSLCNYLKLLDGGISGPKHVGDKL